MATNKKIVTLLDCFGQSPRNDERRSPRKDGKQKQYEYFRDKLLTFPKNKKNA